MRKSHVIANACTSEMSRDYGNNVNRENVSDGCDGSDGSNGSAHNINDSNLIVMTATNQEEINYNIIEKGQGTIHRLECACLPFKLN